MNPRHLLCTAIAALVVSQLCCLAQEATSTKSKAVQRTDNRPLTEDQKILHVLNRLGYGPRPGDVERVKKMGLKAYIALQLDPEKIPDAAVDAKTAGFDTLKMNGLEIAEMERSVQMNNQNLLRIQNQMAQRGSTTGSEAIQGAISAAQSGAAPKPGQQLQRAAQIYQNATPDERKVLDDGRAARQRLNEAGTQLVTNKLIRACESERQLYEVMVDFWSNHFNIDASKVRASKIVDEQAVIRPHAFGKFRDLLNASATSAAMMLYLDNAQSVAAQPANPQRPFRQVTLEELRQAAERGLPQPKQILERIQARAKSDGITEDEAYKRIQAQQGQAQQRPRAGLNENYARELMELHTLGVDGGYTQKDVTEVARCLTGWGVRGGRYTGEFEFHPFLHDKGEKLVLGKVIPAGGGMEDGKQVLDMLASHPSTMRFISTKLCRRFVSDDPPKSLVDKCVATWKSSDGDIPKVLATIFSSKEFFSRSSYKAKIKSPYEFVVSSVRATGGSVRTEPEVPARFAAAGARQAAFNVNVFAQNGTGQVNQRLLCGQIGIMGEPLFDYGFPTGYTEISSKWVSTGALIGRINFALSLVNGRIADVDLSKSILDDTEAMNTQVTKLVDNVSRSLLGAPVSPQTRDTIVKQLPAEAAATPADTRKIASLLLGSPEFQRR